MNDYNINNYNTPIYENNGKKNNSFLKIFIGFFAIVIVGVLCLRFFGSSTQTSKKDIAYDKLTKKICIAAEKYVKELSTIRIDSGKSKIIKFKTLADKNLIETQIKNPYYSGGLFKKNVEPKYYSLENSVRITRNYDGSYSCELVDNSKDVTAPILRLNGNDEIVMAVGTEFVDPGYTATDDFDGDVTDRVSISGSVDNSKEGTYELIYTASDTTGNTSIKKRTIIYQKLSNLEISLGSINDSVAPQITLKGANPYCMVKGSKYQEPGALAIDNVDGDITNKIALINKVTGNMIGTFRVTYKVEDSSGNVATAYRSVIVSTSCSQSSNPTPATNSSLPTISLIGKNSVIINVGTEYVDLGATAYDKVDGDLSSKIVTDASKVNTSIPGIYKVYYYVTNSSNLKASISRTVTVKAYSSVDAVVRFDEEKNNIDVEVGEGNNDLIKPPKAVNEYGNALNVSTRIENYNTKVAVSSIDWNSSAKYRVIYTAVHGNGTIKQDKSIVVTIKEGKVTIGGKDLIEISKRTSENCTGDYCKNICNITTNDLLSGGVTFASKSSKSPIIDIKNSDGIACKSGNYAIEVYARIGDGEVSSKKINVNVIEKNVETVEVVEIPEKVVITSNSSNANDAYNNNGLWTKNDIELKFTVKELVRDKIDFFEWSSDCKNVNGRIEKKVNDQNSDYIWSESGKHEVCIRAVSKSNSAGPWSNPIKLYVDKILPKITFTHTWADGVNDWHNTSELKIEYLGSDSESGLDHYEYTYDDVMGKRGNKVLDPKTNNTSEGNIIVKENTEPKRKDLFVYVRAVDKAGNVGEWTPNPAFANIDTVKPNAPVINVEKKDSFTYLMPKVYDNKSTRVSGINKIVYTLNDGEEQSIDAVLFGCIKNSDCNAQQYYTSSTAFGAYIPLYNSQDEDITYKVKMWVYDKAGNKSNETTKDVVVKTNSTVKKIILKNGDRVIQNGEKCTVSNVYIGDTITLTAVPSPENSKYFSPIWSTSNKDVTGDFINTVEECANSSCSKTGAIEYKVEAKQSGSSTISINIGGKKSSCILNVSSKFKDYDNPEKPSVEVLYNDSSEVFLHVIGKDYNENDSNNSSGIRYFAYTINDGEEYGAVASKFGIRQESGTSCELAKKPYSNLFSNSNLDKCVSSNHFSRNTRYENASEQRYSDDLSKYSTYIPILNRTSVDAIYKIKLWAVDGEGNKSESTYVDVKVKPFVKASKILIKNGNDDVTNKLCSNSIVKVGDNVELKLYPNDNNLFDEVEVSSTYNNVKNVIYNIPDLKYNASNSNIVENKDIIIKWNDESYYSFKEHNNDSTKFKIEEGSGLFKLENGFSVFFNPDKIGKYDISVKLKNGETTHCTLNVSEKDKDTDSPEKPNIEVLYNGTSQVILNVNSKDSKKTGNNNISGIKTFLYTLNDGEVYYAPAYTCKGAPLPYNNKAISSDCLKLSNFTIDTEFSSKIPIVNRTENDVNYKVKLWAVDGEGNQSEPSYVDIKVKPLIKTSKMLIMNGEKDVTNGKCFDGEVKVGDKLSLKIIPNLESSMYGDVGIYLNNAGIIQFNTNHNEAFPKIDSNLNQVIDQKYKFEKGYNLLFGEKSFSFVVKPFKNNTIKVTLINGEETSCTFNVSSESINNS